MRVDVYQRVTDQIIAELEKGVRPWMKPWNAEQALELDAHVRKGEKGSLVVSQHAWLVHRELSRNTATSHSA